MGITKSDIRALILLGVIAVGWAVSVAYYGMYLRSFKDGGDTWGYYIYLPSALISRDLHTLEYVKNKRATFAPHSIDPNLNPLGFGEVNFAENGRPIIKYTCGVSLMMAPFFLIAHALAHLQGTPPDGFQSIYWIWMYIGNAMWVLLGLWVLRRVLLRYVSDPTALVVLTLLAVGTNLYYFVVYSAPMSHAPLFSLYALLIYGSERFYDAPCTRYAAWVGLSAGLIALIRPTEIIALFIPLLWRIDSLGERFRFWRNYWPYLVLAGGCFVLALVPQLAYWKSVSGQWYFYSYGEEGFYWLKPHVWQGLFGFQNGWLIYTPVFVLFFPALVSVFRTHPGLFWPVIVFFCLHVYIIYCWHNWYYINAFGSRPMIQAYALLSLPLAVYLERIFRRGKWVWGLCMGFIGFCIVLNLFQTWQVSRAIMLSEEGHWTYYRAIFGLRAMTEKALITADTQEFQPRRERLDSLGTLADWSLDTLPLIPDTLIMTEMGKGVRLPNNTFPYMQLTLQYTGIQAGDYLRISTTAASGGWNGNRWGMATQTVSFERDGRSYKWRWNRINNKLGNDTWNLWGGVPNVWGEAWFFVRVPSAYRPGDVIRIWLENPGPPIWISDFKVEHWR